MSAGALSNQSGYFNLLLDYISYAVRGNALPWPPGPGQDLHFWAIANAGLLDEDMQFEKASAAFRDTATHGRERSPRSRRLP